MSIANRRCAGGAQLGRTVRCDLLRVTRAAVHPATQVLQVVPARARTGAESARSLGNATYSNFDRNFFSAPAGALKKLRSKFE